MANKYLAREDAPFGSDTWKLLDTTMIETARSQLVGRRLLHIEGPFGMGLKVVPLQDTKSESGLTVSNVLPVVMVQQAFALGTRDLASYERDGMGLDTGPVAEAAAACAHTEDDLIFYGAPGMRGLLTAEGINEFKLSAWKDAGAAADDIIQAITTLDSAGFHGPYALALAPKRYNLLLRRYPQGNLSEMEHVKTMVREGILKAPILKDGGVLLASGREYASIVLGQDMAIGFIGPAGEEIEFSVTESLAVRIRQPQAICALKD
jgi:uncharacterized linocin/CFP29 family protein